jgi:hypothetical protein
MVKNGFRPFPVRPAAEDGKKYRPADGKPSENQGDIKSAGAQIVGIYRQQRHYDADARDRRKDGKKKGGKYFLSIFSGL